MYIRTDALRQLQPSVNGARKLVAHVFVGRPIRDEPQSAPPDSAPNSASIGLPPVQDKPKRKVSFLLSVNP